ncbi:hypothetical protein TOK_2036 [Pseudonocardia sp. N23]|nr:hypothetical protein TOK_2036 [Pseudonocardia sp. N23]
MVPLLAAGVLAVLAVLTVRSAGCDDPGRYELRGGTYELVGGCIAPGDVLVPQPTPMLPPDADAPAKS